MLAAHEYIVLQSFSRTEKIDAQTVSRATNNFGDGDSRKSPRGTYYSAGASLQIAIQGRRLEKSKPQSEIV